MIGIYLSGTGNTKHCLTRLMAILDPQATLIPIEKISSTEMLRDESEIFLAYPTQFSNVPYMVRDFINKNHEIWQGKKVFCLTTMGAFSGDGTGCAARLLRKYGATVTGGLQVRMPDSVCDNKLLKKSLEENKKIVKEADIKLDQAGKEIKNGNYPREGLGFFAHVAGLMGQRLWFYNKTTDYSSKLKINDDCIGCGACVSLCPMGNLRIENGKAVSNNRCAMCYRCISKCPKKAITLLGDTVIEQCSYEKFRSE